YLTLKSKSIITPSIFHGVLNAFGGLHWILLIGGNDLNIGITGFAGFIVLIIFNILLIPIFNKLNKELITTII
ncbi:MAG TPA: CPBP family intramembrane metalloprotease, partial [Caldisericia bacterium]|nr:CPBP family intramembrane metalloprotease [Caldisericia bacterium]